MSDILSVGVIGAGGIAQSHMRAIHENDNIQLVAVMDVVADRAKAAAEQYGARVYTNLEDLLKDQDIEAVHVCTPHSLHVDQVVTAAEAGKHVLVEKPMALTILDCDRMVKACEQAGKILMVGQVMRYYPVNRKIREMIAQGAIGKVGHLIRRRYSYFNTLEPGSRYPRGVRVLSGNFHCYNGIWDINYFLDDDRSEYLSRHDALFVCLVLIVCEFTDAKGLRRCARQYCSRVLH